jgi:ribosomal-protein-alanine N-acetyltransferase
METALSYYVRQMGKEDVAQVNEIDREVFPTQLPTPDYRRELQNPLARLIVVCDENKTVPEPEIKAPDASGLLSKIRQLWRRERFWGSKPQSDSKYILGFASIWVMADEAHLTNIAVRKQLQRQGIGELLLISIMDLAAELKAEFITLEVRVSNISAQRLYQKFGFNQVGTRPGYYTDNREDALLMTTEKISSAPFQARFQRLKRAYSQKYGGAQTPLAKFAAR